MDVRRLVLSLILGAAIFLLNGAAIAETDPCFAKIASSICVVTPASGGECRPATTNDRVVFQNLYRAFPKLYRRALCAVDRIYVNRANSISTGAAWVSDQKTYIEVRGQYLDQAMSLTEILSWKEQLPFGGAQWPRELRRDLPLVVAKQPIVGLNDFLFFIMAHELTHVLDQLNPINVIEAEPWGAGNYSQLQELYSRISAYGTKPLPQNFLPVFAPSSFAKMSWRISTGSESELPLDVIPWLNSAIPGRERICYYECGQAHFEPSEIEALYEGVFLRTNFPTLYSTTDFGEDFAESMAVFLYAEQLGGSIVLSTPAGRLYGITSKVRSSLFAEKRDYLRAILSNETLRVHP